MCDDHSPFWVREERVARFVYRCDECWRRIMRGERHMTTTGKWDGEVTTYRAHILCDMLAEQVSRDDNCRILGVLCESASDSRLTPLQARWYESLTGRKVGADDESFAQEVAHGR